MKLTLKHKEKEISLDVKKVSEFGKFVGLMLSRRESAKALLFDFSRECKISIHSLFVFFPFIAIWIDKDGRIIEIRKIPSWKFRVVPKGKFVKLVEIPINRRYSEIVELLDES